tara:strand:+ start:1470 stop:1895 length:426 start_codon:yes stop_codon:yes gene_type:complete
MSLNKLTYDNYEYSERLKESTGSLSYLLNPIKYENCNKCRHELGLVGGAEVSQTQNNLVDLESDLRGQTRLQSRCPSKKFHPTKPDKSEHLASCQFIDYKPLPKMPPLILDTCPTTKLLESKPNKEVIKSFLKYECKRKNE